MLSGFKQRIKPNGSSAYLKQVATFVHLSDVFVSKDAAASFQLTLALPGPSGDDRLMHTANVTKTKCKH